MIDFKATTFPFISFIKLEEGGSTPLVDSTLYKQFIRILLYLTHSRQVLYYDMSIATRYMQDPHEMHWKETKCILHYVQDTREFGIHYSSGARLDMTGFTNLDWASDSTDRNIHQYLCSCWDLDLSIVQGRRKYLFLPL